MNNRLLRPITSGVHPEAAAWQSAVVDNGGSVSGSTLIAVSTFCAAIDAAGIRDRFYRLNLFCGTGLNACLVPLYRGISLGGSPAGNATDTNVGPFVSGDYTETGASGGLIGNGTNKRLETGLLDLASASLHMSAYVTAADSVPSNFRYFLGSNTSVLAARRVTVNASWNHGGQALSSVDGGIFVGHAIGTNESTSFRAFYAAGVQDGTDTTISSTNNTGDTYVFTNRIAAGVYVDARLGGYSVGLSLTSSQAADFYSAMQAFQTALGRNK